MCVCVCMGVGWCERDVGYLVGGGDVPAPPRRVCASPSRTSETRHVTALPGLVGGERLHDIAGPEEGVVIVPSTPGPAPLSHAVALELDACEG